MSYASEALKPNSKKVLLSTIDSREVAKLFTLDTGSQYYRDVNYFVTAVLINSVPLASGALPLAAGQFYYNAKSGRLYVRLSDNSDPKTKNVTINFRHFFSTSGHSLPFDLSSGEVVNWDSRINTNGALKQSLDDESVGVVVESSSSVGLINSDGFFDNIFDFHIWENREVTMWSWIISTPTTEAQKLFSGIITEKEFGTDTVSFKMADFTFRLRDQLTLPLYSLSDGTIDEDSIGTPKRRIIGRVKQVDCVGVDKTLDGYSVGQTTNTAAGDVNIVFSAPILGDIFQGDELLFTLPNGESEKVGVDSITAANIVTQASASDVALQGSPIVISEDGHRKKNRIWSIAGHKIHEPELEITAVISSRVYEVDSVDGVYAGDFVTLNSITTTVRRISGNRVILSQAISAVVTDTIVRRAVQNVYADGTRFIPDRDYSLLNTTEAKIQFNNLAEFNVTQPRTMSGTTIVFTNGSGDITSTNTELDLRTIIKPRDWIRSTSLTHTTWYEVAGVDQNSAKLVTVYGGTTATILAQYKNIKMIKDDSLVLVDCYGLVDDSGNWIKTPADATKYILNNDAELTQINQQAFDKANATCDYILSLVEPDSIGVETPKIRDVLSRINSSVFGSLYTNANFQLDYSILNSSRPTDLTPLKDDDILSFSMDTKNQILDSVVFYFRPFADRFTGERGYELHTEASDFVERTSGIKRSEEFTVYLYEQDKVKIIAQRMLLFRSLPSSRVKVRTKLNLAVKSLNDKVYLELDRLYRRFGGQDRRKVGIISSMSKNGFETEVEFNDLGGAFNRVGCISPNTQSVYSAASRDEVVRAAFIVDNTTETPNISSETDLGLNLIG